MLPGSQLVTVRVQKLIDAEISVGNFSILLEKFHTRFAIVEINYLFFDVLPVYEMIKNLYF